MSRSARPGDGPIADGPADISILSDEVITLFLGIVDASRVPARAGLAAEHAETVLMRVPIDAALAALSGRALHNGPLIVALQWLALNRAHLGELVRMGSVAR